MASGSTEGASTTAIAAAATAIGNTVGGADKPLDHHEQLLIILRHLGRFRFGDAEGAPSYEVEEKAPVERFLVLTKSPTHQSCCSRLGGTLCCPIFLLARRNSGEKLAWLAPGS